MTPFSSRQRRLLRLSIPAFGLLAAGLILLFCIIVLNRFPTFTTDLPIANSLQNTQPITSLLYLSAIVAGSLSSMLFWWLCIVDRWEWFCTFSRAMAAFWGGLVALLSILAAIPLMWFFFLFYLAVVYHLPLSQLSLIPTAILFLSVLSLIFVGMWTYGLFYLISSAVGAGCAVLLHFTLSPSDASHAATK